MGPGAAAAYLVGRVPGVLEIVAEVGGADRLLRVGERVPRLGELRVEVLHLRVRRGATQSPARLRRQQCAEGRSQGGRDGAGRDRAGRDRAGHEVTSGRQHLSSAALHASSHRNTARDGASNTARRNFRSRAGQSDLGLQQVGEGNHHWQSSGDGPGWSRPCSPSPLRRLPTPRRCCQRWRLLRCPSSLGCGTASRQGIRPSAVVASSASLALWRAARRIQALDR
eukprot:scaffold24336_cov57-Phaeocystis_antarctica.AAC.3